MITPLVNNVIFNDLKQIKKMDELIKKIRAVVPTTEQAKDRTPEYAFGWIDSLNAITEVVKNNVVLQNVSERFSKIEKDAKVDAEAYAVLCDSEDYGEGIRRGVMYGIDYVKKRLFNADEILRLFIVNKDIEKAIRLLKLEVKHYETCSPDALTGIKVRLEELETAVKNCSKH